jgi:tetratricopeptide (TPR) repeat protein/ubiquinone/menaquinone biosynthesis C-methylase UbiE
MEITLEEALKRGIQAHNAGNSYEADRFYTAILRVQPNHPDANHNMGVLAVGLGKVKESLPFYRSALHADPSISQYWISYIKALVSLEEISEAEKSLREARLNGATGDDFESLAQEIEQISQYSSEPDLLTERINGHNSNPIGIKSVYQAIKLAEKKTKDGALEEAIGIYKQILEKYPKNQTALKKIKTLCSDGMHKLVVPRHELESLIDLHTQGKLDQALVKAKTLLDKYPDSPVLHNIVGVISTGLGNLDIAIKSFEQSLKIQPENAEVYNNMANALRERGDIELAIENYSRAIKIMPTYIEAQYNLGHAYRDIGALDESIHSYLNAIDKNPKFFEAHNGAGLAYLEKGNLEAAVSSFEQALNINPTFVEAYNNLGVTKQKQGELEAALENFSQALRINPNFDDALFNLGDVLTYLVCTSANPELQKLICLILDKKVYVRPSKIASVSISLFKHDPTGVYALGKYYSGKLDIPLNELIQRLSKLQFMMKLMRVSVLPDLEIEKLLTWIRGSLIKGVDEIESSPEFIDFLSALALHCYTNEYVYYQTDVEEESVASLEITVRVQLQMGLQPNPLHVLCLASYKALIDFDFYHLLQSTDALGEVIQRQILEPLNERRLKEGIQTLGKITNNVSSKVRQQYEENPYPRWVNIGLPINSASILEVVKAYKLRLVDRAIVAEKKPKILIAGCGTGQESIGITSVFKDCQSLAVDLSFSSLAYAKRKTEEIGMRNIEYMQADILELEKLNREFDIITSAGVLHHMDNPKSGWKVLTNCLKIGGLMRVGLYSESARQDIVKLRQEILNLGIDSSKHSIKSFRNYIVESNQEHHKRIRERRDFYSLSELRDLIFHAKEHRFTIPEIKLILSDLGLQFCGFDSPQIVQHFIARNPDLNDTFDLDKWASFEQNNPSIFIGMYQFWCQKLHQ